MTQSQDDDIKRDSVINISMGETEVLPPVKFPRFEELSFADQLDILTSEVVFNRGVKEIEILIRDLGITFTKFQELSVSDEYAQQVDRKSTNLLLIPKLPEIKMSIVEGAIAGNDAKQKAALQLAGSLSQIEKLELVNQKFVQLTDKELDREIRLLAENIKGNNGKDA